MSDYQNTVTLPNEGLLSSVRFFAWAHRGPGERLMLHLWVGFLNAQSAVSYDVFDDSDPIHAALALDPDNALRLWAAGKLRTLADTWSRAGGAP